VFTILPYLSHKAAPFVIDAQSIISQRDNEIAFGKIEPDFPQAGFVMPVSAGRSRPPQ
jgi:hypothetical protein